MECKKCVHSEFLKGSGVGKCLCPVPWMYESEGYNVDIKIYADTNEDCATFKQKEQK